MAIEQSCVNLFEAYINKLYGAQRIQSRVSFFNICIVIQRLWINVSVLNQRIYFDDLLARGNHGKIPKPHGILFLCLIWCREFSGINFKKNISHIKFSEYDLGKGVILVVEIISQLHG